MCIVQPLQMPSPKSFAVSSTESIYMRPASNAKSLYAQIKTLKVPHLQKSSITYVMLHAFFGIIDEEQEIEEQTHVLLIDILLKAKQIMLFS